MINFNGSLVTNSDQNIEDNRGFLYGDAVFETLKVFDNKILFSEDHYFRLMASLRILRMEIPMDFTLEFMENEILKLTSELNLPHARVRLTVFRAGNGKYLPNNREVGFVITAEATHDIYINTKDVYEVEIFKDFHLAKNLLSTLKTTNCLVNITASIFAQENSYQNCFLINEDKNIVEAINGNVFVVKDNVIATAPVADGCVNGILRKKLVDLLGKDEAFVFEERSISPFELQKADEIFITNVIQGIQSVTKYRKKDFSTEVASKLLVKLNAQIRLNS